MLEHLPATTHVTVLAHEKAIDQLKGMLVASGRDGHATIVTGPQDLEFSVWAQDPYVVMQDEVGGTSLLQPVAFDRRGDDGIAGLLADSTSIRIRRSSLWFQGGDVLVGDDFILVGRDSLGATLQRQRRDGDPRLQSGVGSEALGASLFRDGLDPGRRIVFVGTELHVPEKTQRPIMVDGRERLEILYDGAGRAQPLFHIDLFISLAGRGPSGGYRLLVGSPDLADGILGRPRLEQSMSELFDDVAERLEGKGFEVIRNPLPLTHAHGRQLVEGEERDVRLWYFATANNCLVQIDGEAGNEVWLPTYGHRGWSELAATDAANRRIWEGLGFTVHELPSFHAFAQKFGAVGCITKCLER